MLVFFKFEEEFYKQRGVNVDFVGHPLLDIAMPAMAKIELNELLKSLKFSADKTTIALFPGSRKAEIENILPVMLGAAQIMRRKLLGSAQFIIAKSPQVDWEAYNHIARNFTD